MNASEKVKFISNWIKNYANNMPSKAQSVSNWNFWRNRLFCFKHIKCNDWIKNNCFINAN